MPLLDDSAVRAIQTDLRELGLDGWLFVSHHGMDPIGVDLLGLSTARKYSRRWWYFIPREGDPQKIVHLVEPDSLDRLPGTSRSYASRERLRECLSEVLRSGSKVAMQYSPEARLPMVSLVDAGTVELVRSTSAEVVSSADLLQRRYAQLSDDQIESHAEASRRLYAIKDEAFDLIRNRLRAGETVTDLEVQRHIVQRIEASGMTCEGQPPIVAINEGAANPHFAVNPFRPVPLRSGDRLLLDLWARLQQSRAVYADICWCAVAGPAADPDYDRLFRIVVEARDRAVSFLREQLESGRSVTGAEIDRASREVFQRENVESLSVHRTGHSIDTSVHGRGANIDSYETYDDRTIIPRTCFSIEPALYQPPIGVRSEINVLIDAEGKVRIFGEPQKDLACL